MSSITVDCGKCPLQYITNNAAYTITAPVNDGFCTLLVTNGATAGATTFTGFSVGTSTGDALDTTSSHKFSIFIWRINGVSGYLITAHQLATETLKIGLVSFWEMEDTSWIDAVSGNNLTANGSPAPTSDNTAPTLVGKYATLTSANSDFLSHPTNTSLEVGNQDFSLQAWFYSGSIGSANNIVSKTGGFGNREYEIYRGFTGSQVIQVDVVTNNGATDNTLSGTVSLSSNTWYHMVMTYNNTTHTISLYVNNQVTPDTLVTTLNPVASSTADFNIGNGVEGFWNGRIDQVGFWKKVLSASEVAQLYNSGLGLSYAAM